jgi:hypothetical protein
MGDNGYHAPPIGPENVVYPKTWSEAYEHMKRRAMDKDAPRVSFRDLPAFTVSIDEIVAVQPMTAPVKGWDIVYITGDDPSGLMVRGEAGEDGEET